MNTMEELEERLAVTATNVAGLKSRVANLEGQEQKWKNRRDALYSAVASCSPDTDDDDILGLADLFELWLNRPLDAVPEKRAHTHYCKSCDEPIHWNHLNGGDWFHTLARHNISKKYDHKAELPG